MVKALTILPLLVFLPVVVDWIFQRHVLTVSLTHLMSLNLEKRLAMIYIYIHSIYFSQSFLQ
jgi:hypothetical protein